MTVSVDPLPRLRADIAVPPDKSISHRTLIFNALASGQARIDPILDSEDVRSTAACLRALGVAIDWPAGESPATVQGAGLRGLREPEDVLDCGNSGTTMRLLAGLLAGQPFFSVLTGDASLRRRPMARIITPLRAMGAVLSGRNGDTAPPLAIRGGSLAGIEYRSPVASAQVKSAVLLAGLFAGAPSTLIEPAPSRDHTERMLQAMGVSLTRDGASVRVAPVERDLAPLSMQVPGDISSAAPWLVLAVCHPDAVVRVRGVSTNPSRTGLLDILRAMGADIELVEEREVGGEPVADIVARSSRLHGSVVEGGTIPRAIDELPLVAILGAHAEGATTVRDAAELRAKESDRVETVVAALGAVGVTVGGAPDGFTVEGPVPFRGGTIDARGDHRIGMLAGVAGVLARETVRVENDAVGVSYPRFWEHLREAGAG